MTDAASQALADALAAADPSAVGRALRHDVVIVPLLPSDGGEPQLRIAQTAAGMVLPLFSSSDTLRKAFGDDAPFAVQLGSDLRPLLERHRDTLAAVLFDGAGPQPMQANIPDVLAVLEPQPGRRPGGLGHGRADHGGVVGGCPAAEGLGSAVARRRDARGAARRPRSCGVEEVARVGAGHPAVRDVARLFVLVEGGGFSKSAIALDLTWHAGESAPAGDAFAKTAEGAPSVVAVVPIPDGSGVVRLTFTASDGSQLTLWYPKLVAIASGLAWH